MTSTPTRACRPPLTTLTPIFNLMGVENFTFTAVKKGAATVLKVSGEHMGALIGRAARRWSPCPTSPASL